MVQYALPRPDPDRGWLSSLIQGVSMKRISSILIAL
jgi:hypothetical protein